MLLVRDGFIPFPRPLVLSKHKLLQLEFELGLQVPFSNLLTISSLSLPDSFILLQKKNVYTYVLLFNNICENNVYKVTSSIMFFFLFLFICELLSCAISSKFEC